MKKLSMVLVIVVGFLRADGVNMAPIINYLLSDNKPLSPLEEAKKNFNIKKDLYLQKTFYGHKDNIFFVEDGHKYVHITIIQKDDGSNGFGYIFELIDYEDIFHKFNTLIFLVDDVLSTIEYPYLYADNKYLDYKNLNIAGLIFNENEYFLNPKHVKLIKTIPNSQNASVRMYSSNGYVDYIFTRKDKKMIKDGLELYKLLLNPSSQ